MSTEIPRTPNTLPKTNLIRGRYVSAKPGNHHLLNSVTSMQPNRVFLLPISRGSEGSTCRFDCTSPNDRNRATDTDANETRQPVWYRAPLCTFSEAISTSISAPLQHERILSRKRWIHMPSQASSEEVGVSPCFSQKSHASGGTFFKFLVMRKPSSQRGE